VRAEPGATGAQTDRQERQNTDGGSDERQTHQLLTALLTADLD